MNLVKNERIKKLLFDRLKELNLSVAKVVRDAEERGMKLTSPRMSRYKTGNSKETITEEQLIWLCTRYGIFISVKVGEPVIENGKVKYEVKPYNEAHCLKVLDKIYGKR